MFDFIEKLHQKPPSARKRIALLSSGMITLLIVGVWITAESLHLENVQPRHGNNKSQTASPLDSVVGDARSLFTQVRDRFSRVEEELVSIDIMNTTSTETVPTPSTSTPTDNEQSERQVQLLPESARATSPSATSSSNLSTERAED